MAPEEEEEEEFQLAQSPNNSTPNAFQEVDNSQKGKCTAFLRNLICFRSDTDPILSNAESDYKSYARQQCYLL